MRPDIQLHDTEAGQWSEAAGIIAFSVVAPPTAGTAIDLLARFWKEGRPVPLRTFNAATPYPLTSVAAS